MIPVLINKIASLATIILLGCLLVKCRILHIQDSEGLSRLSLYLVMPCVILSSFQVEYSVDVKNGLLLAFGAAGGIQLILILLNLILKKALRLDGVEQVSVIYSNAGNLLIPLVTAILGQEWVIYTSAYIVAQTIMLWSHGKSTLCGEKSLDLRKIFCNVNMIAILVGILLFFTRIQLPPLLQDTVDTVGGMIGPISMLVTGMLLGSMDLKRILTYKRVWLISFLRLILVPLLILPLLRFSGIASLVPEGRSVLLITFLAVAAPAASSVTQLSQVYKQDAQYACAINVITTIACIGTIPLMVLLYQL